MNPSAGVGCNLRLLGWTGCELLRPRPLPACQLPAFIHDLFIQQTTGFSQRTPTCLIYLLLCLAEIDCSPHTSRLIFAHLGQAGSALLRTPPGLIVLASIKSKP